MLPLPLGLQVMELTENVIFCLNLADEARKKGIAVDADLRFIGKKFPRGAFLRTVRKKGINARQVKERDISTGQRKRPRRTAHRFSGLAFSGAAGFCRCMNAQAAERGCTG